jgi:predicted homoserine dehydrogenase-like protein
VGLLGVSSGSPVPRHHLDLVAHADADLPAGTVLTMGGHHHSIEHVSARMIPAGPLAPETAVPFYLAAGQRLVRPVAKDNPIRLADVEIDAMGELWRLRRQQDANFFPTGNGGPER